MRSRPAFFEGTWHDGAIYRHTSDFVGNEQPAPDDELRRRLATAFELIARLGPALIGPFANIHASFPENAPIVYWPERPWGLTARADLDMVGQATIAATLAENNPAREPVWSSLYLDTTADEWVITYQLPVDLGSRHLITPSIDILLNDLIDTLIQRQPEHGWNLILTQGGDVVAHPRLAEELREAGGVIRATDLDDPQLAAIHAAVAGQPPPASGDASLVYSKATGLYAAAAWIAVAGVLALAALLTSISLILRRRVAAPIAQLDRASRRIASGDFDAVADGRLELPRDNNEIGRLSAAFGDMAMRISQHSGELQQRVAQRTHELETANRELAWLSQHDALTGLRNRRSFDEDLAAAISLTHRG